MTTIGNFQYSLRGERRILLCQLWIGEERVLVGEISQVLLHCKDNNITVDNAQEVLNTMVLSYGFGA